MVFVLVAGGLATTYMEHLFVNNLPQFVAIVATTALALLAIIAGLLAWIHQALEEKKQLPSPEISDKQTTSS